MNQLKPLTKKIIIITVLVLSWLLFPFFTYGSDSFYPVPLYIAILQILLSIFFRHLKLILLSLLNPVVFWAIFYTIIPAINYLRDRPTIEECAYHSSKTSFDPGKSVYINYNDDDCDWEGMYHYTMNINNYWTYKLISLFGNPVSSTGKK